MPSLSRTLSPGLHYGDCLVICFAFGALAGTAVILMTGSEVREEMGYFGLLFASGLENRAGSDRDLFFYICRQRLIEGGLAWLISLTVFAAPCFCLMAAGCGFSMGMILAVTTCQKGIMGLPYYLATMLPQYLFYVPVWCILAMWAGDKRGKVRIFAFMGLVLLLLAGACSEAFLNPLLLKTLIFS